MAAIALTAWSWLIVGVIIAPHLGKSFEKVTERIVAGFSAMAPAEIISRIIGLITGLIIASLSSIFLARIEIIGPYISIIIALLLAYLGWRVGGKVATDGILARNKEPHYQPSRKFRSNPWIKNGGSRPRSLIPA